MMSRIGNVILNLSYYITYSMCNIHITKRNAMKGHYFNHFYDYDH